LGSLTRSFETSSFFAKKNGAWYDSKQQYHFVHQTLILQDSSRLLRTIKPNYKSTSTLEPLNENGRVARDKIRQISIFWGA